VSVRGVEVVRINGGKGMIRNHRSKHIIRPSLPPFLPNYTAPSKAKHQQTQQYKQEGLCK